MRALILILLLSCPVWAGTVTVKIIDTLYIRDATISNDRDKDTLNIGNNASATCRLRVVSVADSLSRTLITPRNISSIVNGEIYSGKLYFYVTKAAEGGHVRLYRVFHDWIEGEGRGLSPDKDYRRPSGGCTWNYYRFSTCTLNTANLPSSFDWRDSSIVSRPIWQTCGSCWAHATVNCLQDLLKKRDFPGGVGAGPNSSDSTDADYQGSPEYQASETPSKLVNTTGAYTSIRLSSQSTNLWDTLSFLVRRYGQDDTGSFVLDKSKMQFAITYRDLEVDPVHCYYETLDVNDGIEATCISSDVPLLNMGGCARIHLNDDFPAILVRLPDVSSALDADTIAVITTLGIMIECNAEYTTLMIWPTTIAKNSHVGTFANLKPWIWDAYDSTNGDSGTCYTYWDEENYKNWAEAGSQKPNEYDLSEQQLIDCVGDGTGCTGGGISEALTWAESTYVVPEEIVVNYGGDNQNCPSVSSSDSIIQIGSFHSLNEDNTDSLKAALLARGPLAIRIGCTNNASYPAIDSDTCWSYATPSGSHAVVLLGWDDNKADCADTTGAWLIKDSKGEVFGDEGCAWISYKTITMDRAYAIELSLDSISYVWSDPGAACTHANCTGDNTSNTSTCDSTACDRDQDFIDSLTVTSAGWTYFDLDVDNLNDMATGEIGDYGWIIQVYGGDTTAIEINGSEEWSEMFDYRPYFLFEVESVSYIGEGIIGKCILGN